MSVAPTPRPILQNLLQILKTYGPLILQFLIMSGIITLPPNVVIPPIPTGGHSAMSAADLEALNVDVEVDTLKMEQFRQSFNQFQSEIAAA